MFQLSGVHYMSSPRSVRAKDSQLGLQCLATDSLGSWGPDRSNFSYAKEYSIECSILDLQRDPEYDYLRHMSSFYCSLCIWTPLIA